MTENMISTIRQLNRVEQNGQRVLTTAQLAECYGTDSRIIANNFNRNKERYEEGKHYICLKGAALQEFKTNHQFDEQFKHSSKVYLWTERGILLHAKSLNTDRAWEVYEGLMEFYFRVKESDNTALSYKIDCLETTVTILQNQLVNIIPTPNYDAIEKWKKEVSRKRVAILEEKIGFPRKTVYGLIYAYMNRMFGFVDEVARSNYAHKYNLFDANDEPIITAIADNELYQSWFIQATDKLLSDWKYRQKEKEEKKHIAENDSVTVHIDKELILHRPFTVSDDCKMIFDSIAYIMHICVPNSYFHGRIYKRMYSKTEWGSLIRRHNRRGSISKYLLITEVPECKQRFVEVCNYIANEYNKEF